MSSKILNIIEIETMDEVYSYITMDRANER